MIKKHFTEQLAIFFSVSKWMVLSSLIGIIIGVIISFFLRTLQFFEQSRDQIPFHYYFLLPFVLILTVWIIKTFSPNAEGHGTEKVIEAIHKNYGKINFMVIPTKVIATILTIFAGASVGKEGPAAQIGAGAASWLSDLLKFKKEDRKKLVICGISAGFAAVFGTPIAGAVFGIEVLIIGIILYDVLLPSFIAGFAAFTTAQLMGIEYTYYDLRFYQSISLDLNLIGEVILAGIFFGIVADMFVTVTSWSHKSIQNIKINPYIKAFIGGSVVVAIALIFGEQYLGLGIDTIKDLLNPDISLTQNMPWYTFIIKTITTSISLGAGGSGGIITPIFYVGASSGHLFGQIMHEHITLFAALGFISIVSGATNAPIAATIMAVELFGLEIANYAALSSVITFLITGHRSVFSSQILAMKKSDILNVQIGKEIENANVELGDEEANQIRNMRNKLQNRREELEKIHKQHKANQKKRKKD